MSFGDMIVHYDIISKNMNLIQHAPFYQMTLYFQLELYSWIVEHDYLLNAYYCLDGLVHLCSVALGICQYFFVHNDFNCKV